MKTQESYSSSQWSPKERFVGVIALLRPHQYYKNFLILLGLIFSGNLFFPEDLWVYPWVFFGFIALCSISSVNYVINDIKDFKKDQNHPEKCQRPLPSGKISRKEAIGIGVGLFIFSLIISIILSPGIRNSSAFLNFFGSGNIMLIFEGLTGGLSFFWSVILIFVTSQLYSLFLKKYVFADVCTIALNYVWRAASGCVLINVVISPWLILLGFLFALLLSLGKRKADLSFLKENAAVHREVYKYYTSELLGNAIFMIAGTTIISYSLYVVLHVPPEITLETLSQYHTSAGYWAMVFTIPLVTFMVLRFTYLVYSGHPVGRHPHKVFFDKQLVIAACTTIIMVVCSLYILPTLFPISIPL